LFSFEMDYWKKMAAKNSGAVPPGQYRFPFSVVLPETGIPPSFSQIYGETTYQLVASVFHRKEIKKKTISPLTLHTHYPVASNSPLEAPMEFNFSQFFKNETEKNSSIRMNISMACLRFYIGRKNLFRVGIENATKSYMITGLAVTLIPQKYIFFEEDTKNVGVPGRKATLPTIEIEVTDGFPVLPTQHTLANLDITIPEETLPTMRTHESPLITLEYEIVVLCKLPEHQKWTSTNGLQLRHHVIVCHPPRDV